MWGQGLSAVQTPMTQQGHELKCLQIIKYLKLLKFRKLVGTLHASLLSQVLPQAKRRYPAPAAIHRPYATRCKGSIPRFAP